MALRATTPIAITAIAHVTTAGAPPGAAARLPIPYFPQDQTMWCWAACCQMVFNHYGAPLARQCDMATRQFGTNCCAAPSSAACNNGCWPDVVYPIYNYSFRRTNASLTPTAVAAELHNGRPVEIYYSWTQGGAHVALITGIFDNNDVWVHDPWGPYGSARRPFSFVQSAYNLGAWRISYSQIQPSPGSGGTGVA